MVAWIVKASVTINVTNCLWRLVDQIRHEVDVDSTQFFSLTKKDRRLRIGGYLWTCVMWLRSSPREIEERLDEHCLHVTESQY